MKTFVSIGSGPGIGFATAARFASEGFRVVLTSRDTTKLTERAARLISSGYQVETRQADAGDLASITALIRDVEAEFGAIDVLHVNSASMHEGAIDQEDDATILADLTVNIAAPLAAIREASAAMLERGSGTILLTGGMFGITPEPSYLSLGIGKAGIRNMTQALFSPFKKRGVHIATVTVAAMVAPESDAARGVAEAFWAQHDAAADSWTAETTYSG